MLLAREQAEYGETIGSVCQSVWNTGLHQRRGYRRRGAWMNYNPQAGQLAEAKREYPWLAEAPSHVLQQTLKDLDRACRDHGHFGHVRDLQPAGGSAKQEAAGTRKVLLHLPAA